MADFTGRVVVKLSDSVQVPYVDAVESELPQEFQDLWNEMTNQLGEALSLDRAMPEFDGSQLQDLPPLTQYFAVTLPGGLDPETVAQAIFALSFVELAYAEIRAELATPPSQTPNDPEFPNETYLTAAPAGVNALAAWLEAQGDGEGVRLVDIEEDWDLVHADLPSITLGSGIRGGGIDHGTSVLGIIAALPENGVNCIGIAPAVSLEAMPSTRPNGVHDEASAMVAAVLDLLPIDPAGPTPVIELPLQSGNGLPLEEDPLFAATAGAVVGLGIAVVEAAGNGGVDLDNFTPTVGTTNPFDRSLTDSGAIIVGACFGPGHTPMLERLVGTPVPGSSSCFGARVDCFAQGAEIVTLASPVTRQFGGTSGASAIVAAAACSVSAMHTAALGSAIAPLDLRALLSDPAVNQSSNNPGTDRIGVMPDLGAIIRHGV
ncbi:MAG: hypothetical protein QOF55_2533 [Thermoleophilaceae bacterium]|nr:hypothetical protein [Thermoleophilaceae bacterium]